MGRRVTLTPRAKVDDAMLPEQYPESPSGSSLTQMDSPIDKRLGKKNGNTVWMEMGALLNTLEDPVNLGQGYPDWEPPEFVQRSANEAIRSGFNQYTRTQGHPSLVEVLGSRYSMHMKRNVDPNSEIAITVGCSQALYLALQALVNEGDEVILLEPFFDLYLGQIKLAGGRPVTVPLDLSSSGEWRVNLEALEAKINPKTKAIIVNTPHNPSGKVFTEDELEGIASIVRKYPQLSVISDEVYKYIINDPERDIMHPSEPCTEEMCPPIPPPRHIHFASIDGMWNRTVTCSSAGKTFSITGWQVGWMVGPKDFIKKVHTLLPYVQFCAPTPMQHALASVLRDADRQYEGYDNYYTWLRKMYINKRQRLEEGIKKSGLIPTIGDGGFFIMADAKRLLPLVPLSYIEQAAENNRGVDFAFCRWLAEEHGIVTIPASPFFSSGSPSLEDRCLVRLAFCKKDEVLDRACERLSRVGQQVEDFEKRSQGRKEVLGVSTPAHSQASIAASTAVAGAGST